MTTLKANYNLLLPDGKTEVKQGEVFEYEGDYSSFAGIVSVIEEGKKEAGKTPEEATEEKALREKARLLGIKNYHVKGIKKLKDEIAELEKEGVVKGADNTPAPAPETAPTSTPAQEDEKDPKTAEGNANV